MRRKYKKIICLCAAWSMVLSVAGSATGPAMAAENISQITGTGERSRTVSLEAGTPARKMVGDTVLVDADTGYSYTLYEVSGEDVSVQMAEITGYSGEQTELVIPAKIDGYDVGRIGNAAFKQNQQITKVVIPEGVTDIGYEAFSTCKRLTEVQIPSTIKNWIEGGTVGDFSNAYYNNAFKNCVALTELTLAEGLSVLGQGTFQGCRGLESLTIPSSIELFYNETFLACTGLKNLVLEEGMKQIGRFAFSGCTALEEVTIPASITSWGYLRGSGNGMRNECCPFRNCTSLKKVTFTEGLKTLHYFDGFSGCPLMTQVEVPASVEEMEMAFADSSSLKTVILHEGVKSIGKSMFFGCSALTDIVIPGTVTSVGMMAFTSCTSLQKLVFPPSVSQFEGVITSGCSNLKEVYVLAESTGDWSPSFSLPDNAKLYCVAGSKTYETFLRDLSSTEQSKLVALQDTAGVEAEGCITAYDGGAHDAIKLSGIQEGDEVLYRINSFGEEDNKAFQKEVPQITEVGRYTVEIFVLRESDGGLTPTVSRRSVTAEVYPKNQYSIHLQDVQVQEGQEYTVTAQGYEGSEELIFHYYYDEALQAECDGKPTAAGVYYVQAVVEETADDAAVQSNVAKITILGKDVPGGPGVTPTNKPSDLGASPTPIPTPNKIQVKKVSLSGAKSKKKKTLTVNWKKVSQATGYQVQIALKKKFSKGKKTYVVKKGSTTKKTIKKLKRKKKYYIRVRAYRTLNGETICGAWSKVKSVKVK